jgi:hypothetical protein
VETVEKLLLYPTIDINAIDHDQQMDTPLHKLFMGDHRGCPEAMYMKKIRILRMLVINPSIVMDHRNQSNETPLDFFKKNVLRLDDRDVSRDIVMATCMNYPIWMEIWKLLDPTTMRQFKYDYIFSIFVDPSLE